MNDFCQFFIHFKEMFQQGWISVNFSFISEKCLQAWFYWSDLQKIKNITSMSKNPGCSGLMTLSNLDVARALQKYLPQNHLLKSGGFDHLKCQDCSVDFWLCSPLDHHLQLSPFCWKSENCIFSGLASTHQPTNQPTNDGYGAWVQQARIHWTFGR